MSAVSKKALQIYYASVWKCKDTEVLTKPQRQLLDPEFYLFVRHHECLMTG